MDLNGIDRVSNNKYAAFKYFFTVVARIMEPLIVCPCARETAKHARKKLRAWQGRSGMHGSLRPIDLAKPR